MPYANNEVADQPAHCAVWSAPHLIVAKIASYIIVALSEILKLLLASVAEYQ